MSVQVAAHPRFDRTSPARTAVHGSGPDDCGTLRFSPYRCFLPDLTGFGDPSCAGPDLQHRLPRPGVRTQTSAREFGPAKADCRCRVPPAPHLARPSTILPLARYQRPARLEKEAPRPLSATAIHLTRARVQSTAGQPTRDARMSPQW